MKRHIGPARNGLAVAFLILLAQPLAADPPARVVRLNLTTGTVSFRPAGLDDWTAATVNRPLIRGDELWTEAESRAEMHVGTAAVRVGPLSSFAIVNETDAIAQLRLRQGSISVRLRGIGQKETWEIDTPNAAVTLLRPGRYRINVTPDGLTTTVTVRGGDSEVNAAGSAFPVHAGEQASIAGATNQTHIAGAAPPPDDFDRWCGDRDRAEDKIATAHVPRGVVGYEDLDSYGQWQLVAGYGWAWTPANVAAGWAPYRFGHWAWIDPWGWTWIDDAPWGFAPFHYGRWAYYAGGWIWVPGAIVRPVYAPALVAFGGGWSASVSVGVAWWPLAPGEVFVPAYAVAPIYVQNINAAVVNVAQVNVTNVNVAQMKYANQTVAGAVTSVPQQAFASGAAVSGSSAAVTLAQANAAHAIGSAPPVAPTPASVLGAATKSASVPQPPASVASRSVVSQTPPPPAPIPFAQKQAALAANPGHPLPPAAEANLRKGGGGTPATPKTAANVKPKPTPKSGKKTGAKGTPPHHAKRQ